MQDEGCRSCGVSMPRSIATATVTIAALSAGGVWAADEPQPEKPATSIQTVTPQAAEAVLGGTIVDDAGKEIGRLVDVLVDRNGTPQAGVIDFGGFLGVGARK